MGDRAAAVERVTNELGEPATTLLSAGLSRPDLRTLLLEVVRRRAADVSAPDLVRAWERDRFVTPSTTDVRLLHRVVADALAALPDDIELLELSPLAPLGTHSAVATVSQDKVATTTTGHDVAADPTNALAVEAALRRRALRSRGERRPPVRLAAVQRVLRVPPVSGAASWQHFTLLGEVAAVRGRRELRAAVPRLVADLVHVVTSRGAVAEVAVTPLRDDGPDWAELLSDAVPAARVVVDRDRSAGRGYYTEVCFKIHVDSPQGPLEVGDGGIVDWTARMLSDATEHLIIGGLGLDRLATVQ